MGDLSKMCRMVSREGASVLGVRRSVCLCVAFPESRVLTAIHLPDDHTADGDADGDIIWCRGAVHSSHKGSGEAGRSSKSCVRCVWT